MKYYVQFTSIIYGWNPEFLSHVLNLNYLWEKKYKGWPDGEAKESPSCGP